MEGENEGGKEGREILSVPSRKDCGGELLGKHIY